jgi:hypothetical protein
VGFQSFSAVNGFLLAGQREFGIVPAGPLLELVVLCFSMANYHKRQRAKLIKQSPKIKHTTIIRLSYRHQSFKSPLPSLSEETGCIDENEAN